MTARIALVALLLTGCKAGPSAFDRGAEAGVPDSADVSELAEVPTAAEVETVTVADTAGADTATSEVAEGPAAIDASDDEATTDSSMVALAETADSVRFPRPEHVRGLYLNAWASGSRNRVGALLEIAARTEVNTFVIDIKDATGYISHPTSVELAHEIGATEELRIRDLRGLLDRLEEAGIYPIARIVIVKDPLLIAAKPELAVQDTAGGVWIDSKEIVWLNPFNQEVWEYHVEIAREVVEMGFPEIQWDYVRFPDAPRADLDRAVFPGQGEQMKPDAIRAFLDYSRTELNPLGAQVTADVFGVTTSASRDVGIGQVWESFIDVVDVALPMVYPSHYWQGSFGIDAPNAYPYEIVRAALRDAIRRSAKVEGAGTTRPWLQDFSLGEPVYEAPEVRAQIQATYDVGIQEWILWNPGSRYTEGALEPAGGFTTEPLMRVASEIVPVSRRFELVDTLPEPESDVSAVADSATVEPDTVEVADTTRAHPDTTGVGR